MRVIPA